MLQPVASRGSTKGHESRRKEGRLGETLFLESIYSSACPMSRMHLGGLSCCEWASFRTGTAGTLERVAYKRASKHSVSYLYSRTALLRWEMRGVEENVFEELTTEGHAIAHLKGGSRRVWSLRST